MEIQETEKIERFFKQIERLNEDVEKHASEWIAYRPFREKAKRAFLNWNKKIRIQLERLQFSDAILTDLDEDFKLLYGEATRKPAGRTSIVRRCLAEILTIYLERVLPKMSSIVHAIPKEIDLIITKIEDPYEKEWMKEAMDCASIGCFRSSVIMGWIAVMWNLYRKIEEKGFRKFNSIVKKKFPKKYAKNVKKIYDLEYFSDRDILLICEEMGIIDRSQRSALESCLDLRNKCSHPGKYKPGKKKIESFFEDVLNNVFT